jgi:protoporphyrinogen oxidase
VHNSGNDKKTVVIAGAGITGLMCALKLKKEKPALDIVVFDKSTSCGGMYGSIAYADDVLFDYGMHVIYESCNAEVDDLYREVMPESEWHVYADNEKDIAGLFFRGKLQTNSHYMDLRSFSKEKRSAFLGDLLGNLEALAPNPQNKAAVFLRNQFGNAIVEEVHNPLLRRMYGVDPEELDMFAIKATALERVALLSEDVVEDVMKSPLLRARIAYPNQLSLPVRRENTQKALYPRRFGMATFMDKLRQRLLDLGVRIMTDTTLERLTAEAGKIQEVVLKESTGDRVSILSDYLLWTIGWAGLAHTMRIDMSDLEFQKGPEMLFINLLFDQPPKMDRLYYFYCYDEGFGTFRVTNYSNYCPAAGASGKYPVCVEFWPSKLGFKPRELSQEDAQKIALHELGKFGVIGEQHKVLFAKVEGGAGAFPLPTVKNRSSLKEIRRRVEQRVAANLTVVGVMADDGLFFVPDVLNHAFAQLNKLD